MLGLVAVLFDAHCHLDFPEFHADRPAALARAHAVGVTRVFVAGVTLGQWPRLVRLRAAHPEVSIGFGLHPWYLNREQDLESVLGHLARACEEHAPSALGEFGLDRAAERVRGVSWALQLRYFEAQLSLASERQLPVVLHVVQAHEEAVPLLRPHAEKLRGGVVHGFSGSFEQARGYVRLGLSIGIGASVLRSARLQRAAAGLDERDIVLETDAPDQSPGGKAARHECADLVAIASKVAELRGVSLERLAEQTTRNACRLFQLAE